MKSTEQAMRFNESKPKYSLLSLKEMEPCVRVLEYGCQKYARDNWRKGLPVSEILDSMMRHICKLQQGEWLDDESGLPHIGHIQANALFLGSTNNTNDLKLDTPYYESDEFATHKLAGTKFKVLGHRATYFISEVVGDKLTVAFDNKDKDKSDVTYVTVKQAQDYFKKGDWIKV